MRLFDTNIVIDQLEEKESVPGNISILTLIELLRGIPPEKRRGLKGSLEDLYKVQNLSNEIILEYCSLYTSLKKEGTLIPEIDLLIAATAINNDYELVSNDLHFERLEKNGLKLRRRIAP